MDGSDGVATGTGALARAGRGSGDAAEAIFREVDAQADAIDREEAAVGAYTVLYGLLAVGVLAFQLADAAALAEGAYWVAGACEAIPLLGLAGRRALAWWRPAWGGAGRATDMMLLSQLIGGALVFLIFELFLGGVAGQVLTYLMFVLVPLGGSLARWATQRREQRAFTLHELLGRVVPAALPGTRLDLDAAFPPELYVDSWFGRGRGPMPSTGRLRVEVDGRTLEGWLVCAEPPTSRTPAVTGLFVVARGWTPPAPGRVCVRPRPPGPAILHQDLRALDQALAGIGSPAFDRRFMVTARSPGIARSVLTPGRRHALLVAEVATPEPLMATWSGDTLYLWLEGPGRALYDERWRRPDRASLEGLIRVLRLGFSLPGVLAAADDAP